MPIVESGITLNFPDNNFFRFQNCQAYNTIQHNFKEMDVCWYDQGADTLYIIELKDWGDGVLLEEQDPTYTLAKIDELKGRITSHRINQLFKKSIDSVCMFVSVLLNKPHGVQIQNCAPFVITNNTTIKLLSIINWTNVDVTYISSIHSAYKSYFKPYATLFGIRSYVVMTKMQASNAYTWII